MSLRAAVGVLLLLAQVSAAATDLGSRVQLFVDEHLIDRKQHAELRLNPPIKREIVLTLDHPWEGPVSAYYTVFRDGEKIRLYYRGGEDVTCYAESADGIHFARPELGLVEYKGSKANNILFAGPQSASFAPFRDMNPDAKLDEKYKALCYEVRSKQGTMTAMSSPDAIHWRRMQDSSVVPPGEFDSLNCVSWDASIKKYRVFDRYWTGGNFKGVRAIESRTSDDFLHWSEPTHNQYAADVPLEHFYTSATTRCPGAEDFWLAFPKRFVPDRKRVASHPEIGVSDAVFMSSRDGVHWDRPFLESWVRPGLDERNWTERSNMTAWGIIETPGDASEFTMYISEHYRWADNRLRRLTFPRHRFASIHADRAGGEIVTVPITFTGAALHLNYATSAPGSITCELQDEAGHAIDGFAAADMQPIYGDDIDRTVEWKGGSLAALAGKPVRLKLMLIDAEVYAIHFD